MFKINMYPGALNWWTQQPKKESKYKAPDKCVFCNVKIEDGDFFHVGYDKYKIYAETCDNSKCHIWLKHKIRLKKMTGKDYVKEAKDHAKEK